jgi:hypothetical protein
MPLAHRNAFLPLFTVFALSVLPFRISKRAGEPEHKSKAFTPPHGQVHSSLFATIFLQKKEFALHIVELTSKHSQYIFPLYQSFQNRRDYL